MKLRAAMAITKKLMRRIVLSNQPYSYVKSLIASEPKEKIDGAIFDLVSFEQSEQWCVGVTYNRTKVLFAIIHETSKFQGNNFIRSWLFLGSYRLAHMWHDFGGVWVHCALHRIPVLGWLLQQPHIRSDDIEEKGTGRIFYSEGTHMMN
ncbi:hypothetical protein G4B88_002905 [Cannabis sativa]|uniref:Uncharacterized protein n=1 Tax=Cannabis sativa TaxID=3483 RepID=A0A7J6GFT9_CANSA|nr:hypothetical protein G4B88_002905 [Cannabis sativa]